MKFSSAFVVEDDDIDEHGHVNNVTYLRWIQDVAVAHWSYAAPQEMLEKFTWFVVRHEIDYKSRAFRDDEVNATTWVGNAGRIKCERFTTVKRDDKTLVEAKSTWCVVNRKTLRPTRISADMIELFAMNQVSKLD